MSSPKWTIGTICCWALTACGSSPKEVGDAGVAADHGPAGDRALPDRIPSAPDGGFDAIEAGNFCNNLIATGPFFLERNHFGDALPTQFTGGRIVDGIYDLIAADRYFPPSNGSQVSMQALQRTVSFADKGTVWNIVDYGTMEANGIRQYYAGYTLALTTMGTASLVATSVCGLSPNMMRDYLYTATEDSITMEYPATQEVLFYARR
jgi:hypothetical protein